MSIRDHLNPLPAILQLCVLALGIVFVVCWTLALIKEARADRMKHQKRKWHPLFPAQFVDRAEGILRKQAGYVLAIKRRRANNWIDLRIIESGVELRGQVTVGFRSSTA